MTLRRKLLTLFGAVGLLSVLLAATTLWATMTLQGLHHEMEDHYRRSLILQSIRSTVTVTFREHVPGMVAEIPGARLKFEQAESRVTEDFEGWARFVQTEEHQANLDAVRAEWLALRDEVETALQALDSGKPEKAVAWMYRFRASEAMEAFEAVTETMAAYDKGQRALIHAQVESTRGTIEIVALVAGAGTLSLVFLLVAYLSSDLFAPLRDLEHALAALARGQLDVRLDERRQDEFGRVHRAFNEATQAVTNRGNGPANGHDEHPDWAAASRSRLIALVREVQASAAALKEPGEPAEAQHAQLSSTLDQLDTALGRMAQLAFPLEPTFTSTVVRGLLYDVLLVFHEELARRAVSVELVVSPEVGRALVDPLLLREAVRELVRNALEALPERGGRLGLRASIGSDGLLVLEVADDGRGVEAARLRDPSNGGTTPRLGLWLVREIVSRHAGHMVFDSAPGEGTHVQLRIPVKPPA